MRIEIATDNAAFDPDPELEVARILRNLADRIEVDPQAMDDTPLLDINGNTVGRVTCDDK